MISTPRKRLRGNVSVCQWGVYGRWTSSSYIASLFKCRPIKQNFCLSLQYCLHYFIHHTCFSAAVPCFRRVIRSHSFAQAKTSLPGAFTPEPLPLPTASAVRSLVLVPFSATVGRWREAGPLVLWFAPSCLL